MRIGVDEVGRGSLAHDVVSCAWMIDPGLSQDCGELCAARLVARDSKAYASPKRREAAFDLVSRAGAWEVGRATPAEIDTLNIRRATLLSMERAVRALLARYPFLAQSAEILVDGRDVIPGLVGAGSQRSVIKGDRDIFEISCASVVAKVVRDREMIALDAIHPGYGFASNAGYGSEAHRIGIRDHGVCAVHRSWANKFLQASASPGDGRP